MLAADTACGVSAAAVCAVVVDSPPTGDDSVAACCDCDGVSAAVSLETEPAGCCFAASSALPVSIPVFVPVAPGARVSVSPCDDSFCLFAANTRDGIALGSTAGPLSVWEAPTLLVSNATAGAVEPSGRCTQPTS